MLRPYIPNTPNTPNTSDAADTPKTINASNTLQLRVAQEAVEKDALANTDLRTSLQAEQAEVESERQLLAQQREELKVTLGTLLVLHMILPLLPLLSLLNLLTLLKVYTNPIIYTILHC